MTELSELEHQRLEELKLVEKCLGFELFDDFEIYKANAVNGLIRFGDEFLKDLGRLIGSANVKNSVRIMSMFRGEVDNHELMQRMYLARIEAGMNS